MDEPLLGLATNEQMIRELICRFKIDASQTNGWALPSIERALTLAEMLGGMVATEREYRTVDYG